ncbi:M15 family metallopeptidase [Microbacterium sp. P04]|uniref:M15 family metallopeptidase n=1 Tax=Microbacterium sp. P04 TaxID=3366947 RepID=UPI00374686DE
MFHVATPVPAVRPSARKRRVAFVVVGAVIAGLLAIVVTLLVTGTFAAAVRPIAPLAPLLPFEPTADDGLISGDTEVTLADHDLPAIARLDPALAEAMRDAEMDAAADGIEFEVTSGWRDDDYQRWLFDDAVDFYGSEETARQYVATPERSSHVTGHAVDIGPLDAQLWLIQYGSAYGICQTYANERWHFERATEPGGVCPEMKLDAEG